VNHDCKTRLQNVFSRLNHFIETHNKNSREEGSLPLKKQTFKIVGQMALLLSNLPFEITSTMDLDTVSSTNHFVQKELESLLTEIGIHLETDSHLIWMPKGTQYSQLFDFDWVGVLVADPKSVILSKYKFNRPKDRKLIHLYHHYFPEMDKEFKKIKQ